jgi:hypothetical protein
MLPPETSATAMKIRMLAGAASNAGFRVRTGHGEPSIAPAPDRWRTAAVQSRQH